MNIFGVPEEEDYVVETDTGNQPLPGQDSQPTQIGKRSTAHMHEAPDKEEEHIAHSQRLHREDQIAQFSAAGAENITHNRRLHQVDQTAQRSAADADNIAHSHRLRQEDQTAPRSATAIKKSSQVLPASPAPPMGSSVTRSQGTAAAEALTAFEEGDPFTYVEAKESPQQDHWKRAMEEESTSIVLNNTFTAPNWPEAQGLHVTPIGSKWV